LNELSSANDCEDDRPPRHQQGQKTLLRQVGAADAGLQPDDGMGLKVAGRSRTGLLASSLFGRTVTDSLGRA
jgi:hypothetical protein